MSFRAPDGSNCTFLMEDHWPILSPPNEKKNSKFLHLPVSQWHLPNLFQRTIHFAACVDPQGCFVQHV